MRNIVTGLLVASLTGLPVTASRTYADAKDKTAPILRHIPPMPLYQGGKMTIQVVVEDESKMEKVYLWFRKPGKERYQNIDLGRLSGNIYEGRLDWPRAFKKGIEYYLEAIDEFGNTGTDGTKERPYFAEVRESVQLPSLSSGPRKGAKKSKRPLWKNPWFWVGTVIAVGGGVAAASSGNKQKDNTGTIIVE